MQPLSLFLAAPPGLEAVLAEEAAEAGFASPVTVPGGVEIAGGWDEARRANVTLRGAGRVLARIAEFRAFHPAQLDKRAHKVAWDEVLPKGVPVKVEATCRRSKIYHAGAAASRVEGAIAAALGPPPEGDDPLRVMVRIEDDLVSISVDTSGEPLHKRGHKLAVGKAPLRETLAALFLRQMGYRGDVPVVDPMCGSGTFVIEAAEWALGLPPGRGRDFALDRLPVAVAKAPAPEPREIAFGFVGSDRDAGAVRMASQNAARAGVDAVALFERRAIRDAAPPDGPPGIVMVNPPYGARIGDRKLLFSLYGAFGQTMKEGFGGWRVGLVTSDGGLAKATGLGLEPAGPPVPHGGLKVTLWRGEMG
ncbi:THUMP domain-containing class I SAM-dependent RNA methyltransferase [Wenxinia marina]|uniref:Wenxma_21, whole genome shotgun sequence n=1 Tax=Wenxinia marina DSM 24838 TaxID=1123501 RepID=A0A0D0Q8H1_9RHOB|nr:RNA methyltransferase [Wenxinia marina]KIQ67423.1 putative N6-adenine-specific DNA methylase [Wenxinia marina DSM 24838]GGL69591.1 RNA methyltransferase [Wenxinia marina]